MESFTYYPCITSTTARKSVREAKFQVCKAEYFLLDRLLAHPQQRMLGSFLPLLGVQEVHQLLHQN